MFSLYQIALSDPCIWWIYFHVPSNQFLHVSHFVILLKTKLEEQAVCKSCDIADFLSVLEKNNNASTTSTAYRQYCRARKHFCRGHEKCEKQK